ncbi:hypothetical protein L5515_010952 [Caenorhabditis briggsae]|uniref:Uncharacterized protein n=1 Tax=Caenorhabditis briggsae TaxID=6238 RepID=A0AAE9JDU4_CAEBR|nr:hypothetical protein L5515_010952 [Caenorhabditis briggsae]
MAAVPDKYFFAGYLGYYTDGEIFLNIIGLGTINNLSFSVRESRLKERGIKLEKNEDEVLVSRVKAFGSVRSIKQNIPVGKYRINIRATKPSEEYIFNSMKYCADVKEPMKSFSSDVIVGTGFAMSNLNISKKKKEFDSERTFSVDLRQPSVCQYLENVC